MVVVLCENFKLQPYMYACIRNLERCNYSKAGYLQADVAEFQHVVA